ncbi:reverse transcriptase domain-containing protein [Tanacetum coccineum]
MNTRFYSGSGTLCGNTLPNPKEDLKDVPFNGGKGSVIADFVVIDFEPDPRVPLILGRSFLKTSRALIDVYEGEITLRVGKEAITFNLDQTSRYTANYNHMTAKTELKSLTLASFCDEYSQEVLGFSDSVAYGNPSPDYDPIVSNSSPTLTPFGDRQLMLLTMIREAVNILILDALLNSELFILFPNFIKIIRPDIRISHSKPSLEISPISRVLSPEVFLYSPNLLIDRATSRIQQFRVKRRGPMGKPGQEAFDIRKLATVDPTGGHTVPLLQPLKRFGAPRAIISDRGTHFCNDQFSKVMLKYGVTHRLSTAYHPQKWGQVESLVALDLRDTGSDSDGKGDNNRICYRFRREEAELDDACLGSTVRVLKIYKDLIVVVVIIRKEAATDSLNIDCDQDKKQQMKKLVIGICHMIGFVYD